MTQKKKKALLFIIILIVLIFYRHSNSDINESEVNEKRKTSGKNKEIEIIGDSDEIKKDQENQNEISEENSNEFVDDDVLNQLILDYNAISEYDIDQCSNGTYPFNAIMSCNGVYIMAYNSTSVFVDLSIEDWNDSRIYPVFRDFMKALDNTVSDDEIFTGWGELLTGEYIGYRYYNIGSIECMCWVKTMNNGTISYAVKTSCETYKS